MDVEAIERATVAAVSPAELDEIGGWIVALDPGTIGRAHSATPLRHDLPPDALPEIEARYARAGLTPVWRIEDAPGLAAVRQALSERGYEPTLPTLVKLGTIAAMLDAAPAEAGEIIDAPDEGWASVFIGEGFDPIDGANRVAALSRSAGAIYARVRDADRTVAVGVMSVSHGWASVHGMRTSPDYRGRGGASRVLAAMAAEVHRRGVEKVFLQVTEENPARALYRRFGFHRIWRQSYWRKS